MEAEGLSPAPSQEMRRFSLPEIPLELRSVLPEVSVLWLLRSDGPENPYR